MIDRERLRSTAADYGVSLSDTQLEQLDIYSHLLVEWNKTVNLTAITEPQEIEKKHFLDSLLLTKHLDGGEKLIDVGTGAGFPGMVAKIACPQLEVCLLDGLDKRLNFLKAVMRETGVKCALLHERAEDAGHMETLRCAFDAATARAVAPLNILSEYCLPFVRKDGKFLAMKGSSADDETLSAENAVSELGGEIADTAEYTLPDGSVRKIVVIEKIADTPKKYPRRAPVIKKKPL